MTQMLSKKYVVTKIPEPLQIFLFFKIYLIYNFTIRPQCFYLLDYCTFRNFKVRRLEKIIKIEVGPETYQLFVLPLK